MQRQSIEGDQPDDLWRWAMGEAERLREIEGADLPILDDTVPSDRETLTHLLANMRDELYRHWSSALVG